MPRPRQQTDSPIARWRRHHRWTQQELATQAGLHTQTVSEAERGYRGEPARSTLEAIAEAFEITVEALLAGPDPEPEPEQPNGAPAGRAVS